MARKKRKNPQRARPKAAGKARRKPQRSADKKPRSPDNPKLPHQIAPAKQEAPTHEAGADGHPVDEAKLIVVGIGASAGGLEALAKVFDGLSAETGAAFVIVQHLAPNHETALPELLSAKASMPVVQATPGVELQPDHAYVMPPNVMMRLEGATLVMSERKAQPGPFTPISHFLNSMALSATIRPIAVILSGSASDGADAIVQIKAAGGITIAQDPQTARFDSMPAAAIQTGMVDLVLSPEAIAAELNRIAGHPYVKTAQADTHIEPAIGPEQYQAIFGVLLQNSGVDFSLYKRPTIGRRVLRRMVLHRIDDVDRYIDLIRKKPAEASDLHDDLLIHVTSFFREPHAFEALRSVVFPTILQKRDSSQPIRVWVPGCSTGEEAYSVAIELIEFLGGNLGNAPPQIFATDVSEAAVERARASVYADCIVETVPADRLRKYFLKIDGRYRLAHQVRDICVFARQDLTRDPPFSKLDLIVCRNVMIYLTEPLQKRLLSIFHFALKRNGYLLLGSSETSAPAAELFHQAERKIKLFQKKLVDGPPLLSLNAPPPPHPYPGPRPVPENVSRPGLQSEVTRAVLERYAPPGVVVNEDMQIVQFRGKTGMFLEPAPGDASLNLLKMAREGLLHGLRSALQKARQAQAPTRKEGLQVRHNGDLHQVSIAVLPVVSDSQHYYLVLFELGPQQSAHPRKETRRGKADRSVNARNTTHDEAVGRLQQELNASREYLQSIIQDLEAANEELQSANEEILSSNEELQSTNEELDTAREELQSTNEELNTLNDELHSRNDELSRVNSDLLSVLASVQIAILMVSPEMRIRRFTPMAERVMNLISADIGRPISHVRPNINCPELEDLIARVIEEVITIEREVQDREGRWWSLRIRPYKDVENRIDGAILSIFDIHAVKQHESQAHRALDYATAILDTMGNSMAVLEPDLRIRSVNRAFCETFKISREDCFGKRIQELWSGDDALGVVEPLTDLIQTPGPDLARSLYLERSVGNGQHRRLRVEARKLQGIVTKAPLVLLSVYAERTDVASDRPEKSDGLKNP